MTGTSEDPANRLKDRLRAAMRIAMQAKRADETRLLRSLLAAIDDAQAVPMDEMRSNSSRAFGDGSAEVPRLKLSDEQLQTLLTGEMAVRREAAAEMRRLGQEQRADALGAEVEMIGRYLAPE